MSYSAGNLELSILGFSENAVASIDVTAKALRRLASSIDKINNTQFVLAGQKMEVLFTKISQATSSIDTKNISNLATAARSLSSISKIGNLEKVDFTKVGNGFSTLTVAITPFINKVKEAETSLNALYGILSKSSGKKIGNLLNGSDSESPSKRKGFSSFLNIGKWTAVIYSAKRLGSYMAKVVQYGADYTETLNLWETAMGGNLTVATEFVNKMNEAYGISEKTLMNAQAIFKNMLGSLGQISDTMAYALSEGVTQMALDYASLYNVTFEQAFTKFQAALAGQVRPIRSVAGYDITENTLFQLYQSLGGEKTMRQLSRTEKQLLSILAIFNQMNASGAVGDLNKTMESFANQSRVMAEGWQRTMTYSGVILTHLIEQSGIMTYLNAVLIFLGDTLKAVAESMGAIKSFADPFESTTEGALDAGEAIDNVKEKLLGFDKFRALDQTSGNDLLSIDKTIINAMTRYDTILENSNFKARELADTWLEALGYVDANNDGIIDMQGSIDQLLEKIKTLNWGKALGEKVAEFINYIDLSKLAKGIFSTIDEVLTNAWEFVANLVINIDWQKLGQSLIDIAEMIGTSWIGKIFNAMVGYWTSGSISVPQFANGGLPDKGTMFVAGEAGAEMVYNMPNGQSGVANVRQIEQAMFNALASYGEQNGGAIVVQAYLDGEKVYENTTARAKSQGFVWAKA